MSDETTTEQLAEIEGQPTEFTPPEGWRLLEVGETLTLGDEIVQSDDGRRYPTERVGSIVGANQRYIRRIERQPEPQATEFTPPDGWQSVPLGEVLNEIYIRPIEIEPEPEPQPIQVREGRWRKRSGAEVSVSAMPTDHDHFLAAFPWWDGQESTWTCTGHLLSGGECPADLVTYLGPIEEEPEPRSQPEAQPEAQPEPQPEPQATQYTPPEGWRVVRFGEQLLPGDMWVHQDGTEQRSAILHWDASAVSGGRCIRRIKPQPEPQPQPQPESEMADELRSEIHYLQKELGSEKRRVVELEALVASLRTIYEGSEKAVDAAGQENTALRRQLAVAKEELTTAAAVCQQLQIELDAAQQVPADSPELRQLRLRLADMTLDRDTYKDAYDRIFADLCTIKETTKAETVEAIVEWLEPVRATIEAADNVQQTMRADNLACDIIRNLPGILRYVVGLDSPEDVE